MSLGNIQPPFGTTKDSIKLDDYLAKYNSSPVEELNFLAPRKTITGKFVQDKNENETMSLGTMEQREEIKNQAQELIDQAYQKGYKAGEEQAIAIIAEQRSNFIEQGRNEAWEAAKKLCLNDGDGGISQREIINLTDGIGYYDFLKNTSVNDAIKKISEYENQKKHKEDSEIHVGDEVTYTFDNGISIIPFVVLKISCIDGGGMYYEGLRTSDMRWVGGGLDYKKTGRHFHEIAEVLKKMQEGE